MARGKVSAEDRLFSLVLALLATEQGLTKTQIFQTIRGYDPETNPDSNVEALERRFERDKNDLRDLGIPLETIESPDAPGDNQLLRYRISPEEYVFPADISFSPAEITLLNLAGDVWREGTVSEVSHRALTKLRAFDIEPDAPILGYVPRLRAREAVFDELNRAIEANERVGFDYLKAGDASAERRDVTPYALGLADGRWHLLAFDHERDAERTFLLSRIQSKLSNQNAAVHAIPADAAQRLLAGLKELAERNIALLDVVANSTSAAVLRNRPGSEELASGQIRVHFLDEVIFAEEIAGGGPEIIVVSPDSLRARVSEILHATLSAHGGAK